MAFNICMASDDNYIIHLGVSIISILENNPRYNFDFHILNDNISEVNLNKLKSIEDSYSNVKFYFYDIHKYFKDYGINGLINVELKENSFLNLLGLSAFSRLFIADLIPQSVGKILYLDADTIVLNDLKKLFEIDLDEYYVAGVIDVMSNIAKFTYQGDKTDFPFVNSGVLLINLDKWREINFKQKAIDLIYEYPDKNLLNDQNIINIICLNNVLLLDSSFNVMSEYFYVDYSKRVKINSYFDSVDYFYSKEEIQHSLKNPAVIHFISQIWDRPWVHNNNIFKHKIKNPFYKCYDYYKLLSPWKDDELISKKFSLKEKLYNESIRFFMMHFPARILSFMLYIKIR